jgi:hypothetical protein
MPRPTWEDVHGDRRYWPFPELEQWVREVFIEGGPLYNADHEHLQMASIGFVMAAEEQKHKGQRSLGFAQLGDPGGKVNDWFHGVPDFLITLDAGYLMDCDAVAACAVIEHELYHCGHAKDKWGEPKYDSDDRPVFWIRPHDIEEFSGVIARYGAWNMDLMDAQRAMTKGPEIPKVHIDGVCGCGSGFARR